MALNYGPKIIRDGLVLNLDAADINSYPGSGTTWFDISGNNNHVSAINGPTWNSLGYFANDGDSYFSGGGGSSIPIGNSTYTMAVWARQKSIYGWGGANGFISIGGYGTVNQSNALRTNSNAVGHFWHYWWGNDVGVSNNTTGISLDKWFYVAVTFDGTTRRIWANGVSVASDTPGSSHNVTSTTIQISKTVGTEYQVGDISIAKIYNRSLSSTEIQQNYNATKTRFGL